MREKSKDKLSAFINALMTEGKTLSSLPELDLKVGDIIMTGRFKNKKVEVKEFGTDANGQPTVNGRQMLTFRIEKLMPKKDEKSDD